MHTSAKFAGQKFFDVYWREAFKHILDVGSLDVNGSLREMAPASANYLGIDLVKGKGVDRILDDPYIYPFPDGMFDAILSTSCFEHDRFFWLTFLEAGRVLSDRGFLYVNAPSRTSYHHPPDQWRFFPDAGVALEHWGHRNGLRIKLVESFIITIIPQDKHSQKNPHCDCVMIFSKDMDFKPSTYLHERIPGSAWVRKGSEGRLADQRVDF